MTRISYQYAVKILNVQDLTEDQLFVLKTSIALAFSNEEPNGLDDFDWVGAERAGHHTLMTRTLESEMAPSTKQGDLCRALHDVQFPYEIRVLTWQVTTEQVEDGKFNPGLVAEYALAAGWKDFEYGKAKRRR